MKKIKLLNLGVAGLLLAAVLAMGLMNGCATTQVQTSIKAEGALITSVDVGMNLWRDYVTRHVADGRVTQQQIDTVRQAYNAYYTAQTVAKAAIEKVLANVSADATDVTTANAAVNAAKDQLLALLNQYIH